MHLRTNRRSIEHSSLSNEAELLYHDKAATLSLGCRQCRDFDVCGGLFVGAGVFSCEYFCTGVCIDKRGQRYLCPCDAENFVNSIREVKGLGLDNVPRVPALSYPSLPCVIPLLYGSYQRVKILNSNAVVIPLNRLFSRKTGKLKFMSRRELADRFRFDPNTKIVISGVGKDEPIEDYWSLRRNTGLIDQIAKLRPDLITAPNFSLFLNVPRWDNLHNIKRIALCWSEIVSAGIPCSLHVNGRTDRDWERWAEFIAERDEVKSISFEFATPAHVSRLNWHADKLVSLAAATKRKLQIIVRGGSMHLSQLNRAFHEVVAIDSSSYMKTVHRRRLYWKPGRSESWRISIMPETAPLDELLHSNITTFRGMTANRLSLLW
jgi:hypothetical protein